MTESDYKTLELVNNYCRSKNVKFITSDVNGVFSRVFCDFG